MTGWAREPLVHFLVLGALIFLGFQVLDDTPPPVSDTRLEVTQADADRLAVQFEATWRRAPTEEELAVLIDRFVRDEVLVREALALGLDNGDAIVRQRLVQKMVFLAEGGAEAIPATDESLQAHLDANPQRFERPALVSFEQILLRRDLPADLDLTDVPAEELVMQFAAVSLLPETLPPSPASVVDGTFGSGFFAGIAGQPPGDWVGPVESSYGRHMVRVLSFAPAQAPDLAEVRDAVERDWRAATRDRLVEERIGQLISRYDIVLPDRAQGSDS